MGVRVQGSGHSLSLSLSLFLSLAISRKGAGCTRRGAKAGVGSDIHSLGGQGGITVRQVGLGVYVGCIVSGPEFGTGG